MSRERQIEEFTFAAIIVHGKQLFAMKEEICRMIELIGMKYVLDIEG